MPVFEVQPQGRRDMIVTKFRFDQVYDTNLIGSQGKQFGGTYSDVEGDVSFLHQHPGSLFMFTYRGGGYLYPQPQYSNLNAALNTFRLQLRQSLTKRMNMSLAGDWGSLPGGAFAQSTQPPVLGGGDQNAEFLARRSVSTDATLSFQYQVTSHTYFSWGGNYYKVRYEPSSLSSSRSENAFVTYYYKFARSQTLSFGFANQWIDFPGTAVHAQVHNILTTYSNSFTPTLTFNGYVGPAFVDQTIQPAGATSPSNSSQLNVVGGAALTWVAGHSNAILRYDRMYSRGSGQIGTSLRQISGLTFSQSLSRHLVAAIDLNYTTNDVVSFPLQNNSSFRIQPTVRYHMRRGLWIVASEGYVRAIGQTTTGAQDRNVVRVGLEYNLPNLVLEK